MKAEGKELVWLDNVFLFSISYSLPSFSRANFKFSFQSCPQPTNTDQLSINFAIKGLNWKEKN
jgi:hypothetical protein